MNRWIVFLAAFGVASVQAEVDLEWRVENTNIQVGDTVRIGLCGVADNGGGGELFAASGVIVAWDPEVLGLLGVDDNGPYEWLFSGFPDDSCADGLNNTFDDGDAYYQAWSNFNEYPEATPEGLLFTTFEFEALASTPGTQITIVDVFGVYSFTYVSDEEYAGWNIVGDLGSVVVVVDGGGWPLGDMNCDGVLDFEDINPFILAVGDPDAYAATYPECDIMNGDINDDGAVDFEDINPFIALLTG